MAAPVILDCQNFKFLAASQVRKASAHQSTEFYQHWSNISMVAMDRTIELVSWTHEQYSKWWSTAIFDF